VIAENDIIDIEEDEDSVAYHAAWLVGHWKEAHTREVLSDVFLPQERGDPEAVQRFV
jgi:hypothetical protein